MKMHSGQIAMVVAERGSAWKPWADCLQAEAPEVILVRQQNEETPSAFAARVRSRVAELNARGVDFGRAVLVGGEAARRDALSARSLMIRAIAASMAENGGGEVLLHDHGSDRFTMRALASTVSEMVRGTGVEVTHADSAPAYANVA